MELCSIASGSSGNCIMVGAHDSHLIIDAGISGKRIEQGLNSLGHKTSEMKGVLVTHEHIDHISGLGVIARRYGLPIYTTAGTMQAILQTKSVGKIDESLFHIIEPDHKFMIGELEIEPIQISHDAADPVAYLVRCDGRTAGVVTDLGTYDQYMIDKLRDIHVLLLEANHDVNMLQMGPYPYPLKQRILGDRGHLSNELSGQLLGSVLHDNFNTVVLGHLSKENNYAELAYETVRLEVTMGDCPYTGNDFPIHVAKRDQVSELIAV
ncbi:MBL fold metallo-hydrolase [Roseburia sp. BX1005]|uniref:MBL fold metallo-hydrolase n=1 Tax=Roseburia zhanii TaxID=2763064 RepID=A0A923LNB0_9FIRM|nr:MBL fold metallo-hydrolase [Roseburia zhanii]MBC5713442.1 MBL fold metallo-hydrolase [Roseburia zhanii]